MVRLMNLSLISPMDFNFDKQYENWALGHSVINILGLGSAVYLDATLGWFVVTSFSFFVLITFTWKAVDLPYGFGFANWVTTFRLVSLLTLALVPHQLSDLHLFGLLLLLITLDGLDGYVARRWSHQSRAGELLDMETDAFLVLLMAWWHFSSGKVGWWILVPGAFRYIYELFGRFLPEVESDYLPKKVRATIAVIFFIALLIPFIDQGNLATWILGASSLGIMVSFGLSIFFRLGLIKK